MIYYSTLSDDCLWKLIFCGKQKKKGKKKKKPEYTIPPRFSNGRNKSSILTVLLVMKHPVNLQKILKMKLALKMKQN